VKELEQYTFETNISGWKHLSGAYIFVKSKIKNNPNNYATLISNLIEFSGDVSDTSASQLCWYPDAADSADTSQYTG
jgi:hypothetical protein